MAPALTAVTDRVHFVRTDLVNWTLVADDDGVLLIDAGFPGDREDVLSSIAGLGYRAEDLRAILLTHAHVDHLGAAVWLNRTYQTPVYCHRSEVAHTRREHLEQVPPRELAVRAWRPSWLRWTATIVRRGALDRTGIPAAQALTDAVAAGLPGRPIAVPTPGHTGGHCSYLVDGVLVAGDALVTSHPVSSHRGPQLLHRVFNHDQAACLSSLDVLAGLDTEVLLPGHGELWHGPIRELAAQARRA